MSNKPKTVTIPFERYEELLDAERELGCLDAAGVDNWDGYMYAMQEYYGDDDE